MNLRPQKQLAPYLVAICTPFGVCTFASNVAAKAPTGEVQAKEAILPKIVASCGTPLEVRYDVESLRKHNQDIRYDQTDGALVCDEPLRYLWYACKSPEGRKKVQEAGIREIRCSGVAGNSGTFRVAKYRIEVGRAFEEKDAYVRSRAAFEKAFEITLPIAKEAENPYHDEAWHDLRNQPNPVTGTASYCMVNGNKEAFDEHIYSKYVLRKEDAKIKCWQDKVVAIDLKLRKGKKNGLITTYFHDAKNGFEQANYYNDKLDGDRLRFEGATLVSHAWYRDGQQTWKKEFFATGQLKSYSRKFARGIGDISLDESGRIYRLDCNPDAKIDAILRRPCGFYRPATLEIYDGTKQVNRIETWENGVRTRVQPGTSKYSAKSVVEFLNGKKHGEEKILQSNGKLASSITWNRGVKNGIERAYAEDGERVVTETIWKNGNIVQSIEYYLNGKPKVFDNYLDQNERYSISYFDSGATASEVKEVLCMYDFGHTSYELWCGEGAMKTYYESGVLASWIEYRQGKLHGKSTYWDQKGKRTQLEEFVDGVPTREMRWDKDGKLEFDRSYEPDFSRKLTK